MRGAEINYVHIEMLRRQAQLLQEIKEEQGFVPCERSDNPNPCEEPAEYLVPDAAQHSSEGLDIEIRPAWFCRSHLSELLGRDPGEQPFFRHIEDPEE